MTIQEINILLKHYDEGTTTEAQERELRRLALANRLPDQWNEYFVALDDVVEVPDGLQQRLEARIDTLDATRQMRHRHWWRRVAGIAATVAILLSVGLYVHNQRQTQALLNQDTYTDPQAAYNETEQVLTQLANQLNKGGEGVDALKQMSDILNSKS
jgi:hypothetical protein